MYERSAIVLERYFENLFGINKPSNIVQNYKNYCELFEKFNNFQTANSEEFSALEEFQASESAIEDIQAQEENLYKKNAKYEYNRDLIFNDISQKPDEIEKCMEKIEGDIAKTQNSLVTLRENFVEAVRNYNEKKSNLSKCKKNRKNAEAEYNAIFEVTKQNIENILEEYIEVAKSFSEEDGQEELIEKMLENGKDEKIPFNNSVIRNAVKVSFDIQKRCIEAYVDIYNKTNKLISELLEGAVSVELHEKTIRNTSVKFNFLSAEKDYLVQFLDYERIMVIHGKRMHRNLMLEACENFNTDVAQIDNLYTLLNKEITNKSTKKAYKELYNKSYLIDIEENDEKFKKEKNKINLSTATIMNTNYWRIEGIKNIYTVFYKDVVEVFGKTVDEFEVPKDPDELEVENEESLFESAKVEKDEIVVSKPKVKESTVVIEQVSEDAPALPGMAEAIEESEKEVAKKAESKSKATKKKEDKVQVIEEVEEQKDAIQEIEIESEVAPKKKKTKKVKRYTRKKVQKENIVKAVTQEKSEEPSIEDIFNEEPAVIETNKEESYNDIFDEIETELDIFGEKYRDIEKQIAELDFLDDLDGIDDMVNAKVEALRANGIPKLDKKEKIKEITELENLNEVTEDMPYEDEEIPFEEESIFENIDNEDYEELNLKKIDTNKATKQKKNGLLKNIMKLNAKDNKKVTAN